MEKSNFTEVIRSVCAQFNPVLDITPIQFRRFNVTMVFSGQIVPKDQVDSFISIFSLLLGCSESVMKRYYNRWNTFYEMDKALNTIQKVFYTKELTDAIEEGIKLLDSLDGMNTKLLPAQDVSKITRPIRTQIDDDEFIQYLSKVKNWEKLSNKKQFRCMEQVKRYKKLIKLKSNQNVVQTDITKQNLEIVNIEDYEHDKNTYQDQFQNQYAQELSDNDKSISEWNLDQDQESPGYQCSLELRFDGSPLYSSDTDDEDKTFAQNPRCNNVLKLNDDDFDCSSPEIQQNDEINTEKKEDIECMSHSDSDDDCNGY